MPKITFPIVGTYNRVKQRGINPEETFNMYLINQGDDKVPDTLINTPGFKFVSDFSGGTIGRGLFVYQDAFYAVVSEYVYKITSTLQPVKIGQLNTITGYVQFSGNNGNQIMIVDGENGYIYNVLTNTFVVITDADFLQNPQSVTFLDGRFVVSFQNSNQFQLSALNDGTVWSDPGGVVMIQSLQTTFDKIQAVAVIHRILFLFGTKITECWNDVGAPDFPLARLDNMNFEVGTAARGSVIESENMLIWLGRSINGTTSLMMSNGGMPVTISTTDVDQEINNYVLTDDARGYLFRENGYTFYALNFTNDNVSWLYNQTNNTWTKQKMLSTPTVEVPRHKLLTVINYKDLNYALAYDDANLYELSQNYTTNNGEAILKERITHRFFDPTLRDIRVSYIEVDCLHGFAPATGVSADPFIELSVSRDAGSTFGKSVRSKIGRIGQRAKRSYWHNLGINKDFVFRFRNYDDIQFYIRSMSLLYALVGPAGDS